jgi:FO synthase
LAAIQDTAFSYGGEGFTEFVPLPFVHHNAPIYLAGLARPGPTERDNRAVHAFARLALHGRIDHVQVSWVKLGDELAAEVLRGGADDMGGTLMEETISRMAGSEKLTAIAAAAGRPVRQRSTTYREPVGRLEPAVARAPRLLPLTPA